ncbi:MAG: hypothetical protein OSW77_11440 [Proteobacteria bacterium]|jgi:hypothetical protein|nr:hypothetical protein [Pseudomonadota bacterium]
MGIEEELRRMAAGRQAPAGPLARTLAFLLTLGLLGLALVFSLVVFVLLLAGGLLFMLWRAWTLHRLRRGGARFTPAPSPWPPSREGRVIEGEVIEDGRDTALLDVRGDVPDKGPAPPRD